ncbi:MFS transporter [Archangium gephyra]|nr:MFS transporter [Archangium gephyra]
MAQFVLGLGGLFIGTGEFAAMGLLPDFARSVDVSIPEAGQLISAYALGVVIGSPLLAVATARMERRRLLVLLALMVLLGNVATALAPSFWVLAAARFFAGLPHGAYYGTASLLAAAMVPRSQRASAIGRVMLGLAVANVIGVPGTTFLGQALGWQSAFAAIGIGGALLAFLLPLTVPSLAADEDASPVKELSAFGRVQVWLTLATAAIGFAGMFAVYSYITPTLTQVTGQPESRVPLFLGLLGLGMVAGNLVGGWLADRAQTATIVGVKVWNAVLFALFVTAAGSATGVAIVLFLIGAGFAAVPALQARLMDAAPGAQSLAAAMNHSAFNLSNAIGAWAGGFGIAAGWGYASTGYVAAVFALGGLLIFLLAVLTQRGSGQRLTP